MSKLNDANKKLEDTLVKGYKKLENTVVGSYKKIEDKFVDTFLKHDDETIEEAKVRIKKEQEKIAGNSQKYSKSTEEIQNEIKEKYGR